MATQVKKGIAPKKNVTAKPKIKKPIVKKATKKPLDKNPAARQQLPPPFDGIRIIPMGSLKELISKFNEQEADNFREMIIKGTQEHIKDNANAAGSIKTPTVEVKPALESMVDQLYDNNATASNYIEQIEIALNKIHNNQPNQQTGLGSDTIKEERTLLDKFNSRLHWQNSLNHRLFDILQQLNEIA